jgi:hypothetical protein
LGALFFLSIPDHRQAVDFSVYVDLGLIFFSTASLVCLLTWIDRDLKLIFLSFQQFAVDWRLEPNTMG